MSELMRYYNRESSNKKRCPSYLDCIIPAGEWAGDTGITVKHQTKKERPIRNPYDRGDKRKIYDRKERKKNKTIDYPFDDLEFDL